MLDGRVESDWLFLHTCSPPSRSCAFIDVSHVFHPFSNTEDDIPASAEHLVVSQDPGRRNLGFPQGWRTVSSEAPISMTKHDQGVDRLPRPARIERQMVR